MKLVYITVFSIMLFTQKTFSQIIDNGSFTKQVHTEVLRKFNKFIKQNRSERIYIHIDKPSYLLGDDIWFNVYLLNDKELTDSPHSNIVYFEIISPENKIISTKSIKIVNGIGNGDFSTKGFILHGKYTFRAYTNLMRNYGPEYFFQEQFEIKKPISLDSRLMGNRKDVIHDTTNEKITSEKISFQMFPEGANLVQGISSVVGFVAKNPSGKGINIEGKIFDQSEKLICSFNSNKYGIGAFNIIPQKGKKYHALITKSNKIYRFPLPEVKSTGHVIKVINNTDEYLFLQLNSNTNQGLSGAMLIGHIRGNVMFTYAKFVDKRLQKLKVNKALFPDGILHFTLFDADAKPRAERLVFIQNKYNKVRVVLSPNKKAYETNQEVKMNISLKEVSGEFVNGKASISVYNNQKLKQDNTKDNIQTRLLFTSDLKGKVENPAYYLENINDQKISELDHLMLSHQWQRFKWLDILNEKENELLFSPEKGFTISGKIVVKDERNMPAAAIVTLVSTNQIIDYNQIETNENGRFTFTGFDFKKPTQMIIQVKNKEEKNNKNNLSSSLAIELDQFENPPLGKVLLNDQIYYDGESLKKEFNIKKDNNFKDDILAEDSSFQNKTIMLEELTIKSSKRTKKDPFATLNKSYTKKPDYRVIMDSLPNSVKERNVYTLLASQVPGLQVWKTAIGYYVLLSGRDRSWNPAQPIVTIDNISYTINELGSLDPRDIHHVDIVNAPTIYGGNGAGGLIAVYTKLNFNKTTKKTQTNVIGFTSPSYDKPRNFHRQNHDLNDSYDSKTELKGRTVYWNPNIRVEEDESFEFKFSTLDKTGRYKIVVEGITDEGIPFTFEDDIIVEEGK